MTDTQQVPGIYRAINNIMSNVGYVKKSKAPGLNYTFAGESALIAALRPEMVEQGVVMVVTKISNVVTREYQTSKGTQMVNVSLTGTVRFYHIDGSYIEVESAGEGSDTGDKATAKAMTAMYKYALRETFCIETGDDPDKYPSQEAAPSASAAAAPLETPYQAPAPAPVSDDDKVAPPDFNGIKMYRDLVAKAMADGVIRQGEPLPENATIGQVRALYRKLNQFIKDAPKETFEAAA